MQQEREAPADVGQRARQELEDDGSKARKRPEVTQELIEPSTREIVGDEGQEAAREAGRGQPQQQPRNQDARQRIQHKAGGASQPEEQQGHDNHRLAAPPIHEEPGKGRRRRTRERGQGQQHANEQRGVRHILKGSRHARQGRGQTGGGQHHGGAAHQDS